MKHFPDPLPHQERKFLDQRASDKHPRVCPSPKTPVDARQGELRTEFVAGYNWANVLDEGDEGLSFSGRDHADTSHNYLHEMCVSLFVRFSFSWRCRRRDLELRFQVDEERGDAQANGNRIRKNKEQAPEDKSRCYCS